MSDIFTIHTDGGSRGNPGPAAFAYTIARPGQPDVEAKGFLGSTTNNIAEYTALVKALEHARQLGGKRLIVNSDSELLVQQMNGKYKVRHAGLLPLYQQARRLCEDFDDVRIRHIYREHNKRADQLCNQAMDDRDATPITPIPTGPSVATAPAPVVPPPTASPTPPPAEERPVLDPTVRARGIALIRSAAQAWADDEDDAPTPEQLWTQIWRLIHEKKPEARG